MSTHILHFKSDLNLLLADGGPKLDRLKSNAFIRGFHGLDSELNRGGKNENEEKKNTRREKEERKRRKEERKKRRKKRRNVSCGLGESGILRIPSRS